MLLVDATNAFNTFKRQVALLNIRRLCPPIAMHHTHQLIQMPLWSVSGWWHHPVPSRHRAGRSTGYAYVWPSNHPNHQELDGICEQIWYADDSAAVGIVVQLHAWWTKLVKVGPVFDYFPNPAKAWLVTKQDHFNLENVTFRRSGVNVTPERRPYLGAAIGTHQYIEKYVWEI